MVGRVFLTLAAACLASLLLAQVASAARTVYLSDPEAGTISQFAVGAGGALTPLAPATVDARGARRLAMTPAGRDLYATASGGVLQFDVAPDGRLTTPVLEPTQSHPRSIAVHPGGASAYVTDGRVVRQYTVGTGGGLAPKDPPLVEAGPCAGGLAVSPNGRTLYVLVQGGIVVFDVGAGGRLTKREGVVEAASLEDVALTPDGRNLYATSRDGRVLQFNVGADGALTPKQVPAVGAGTRAVGIAVVPGGSAAYVSAQVGEAWQVSPFAIGAGGGLAAGTSLPVAATSLSFLSASPDGRSLFLAGDNGYLFDLPVFKPKTPPAVPLGNAVGVVVSPNQAPVASFTVISAPAVAGSPTQFDARSASDSDGTIVRYDWDFGDGTLLANGGPTPQHTYTRPGTYVARLVVTDNEGASTGTVFTGGTVLGAGGPGAQTSRSVVVAAAAAAPPPSAPPGQPAQALVPDLGRSLLAVPVRGEVFVRLPGTTTFQPLENLRELPLGSTIDTRKGRVELTTVRNRRSTRLQDGVFHGGLFKVRQRRRDKYVTELLLRGRLSCPRASSANGVQAQASRKRRKRRLWGNGRGRFRSRGRYSSATVRGTIWLVEDRCGSTLTRVRRGKVKVRDFARDRSVVLRRGDRYVARKAP